ncbi:MAG: hypothetical protein ACP5GI_02755 [Sulfolobales archaeon]
MPMTMLGVNTKGHRGWVILRCGICNKKLYVGEDIIYICPNCSKTRKVVFCKACARITHYKCPYCGTELQLYP